MGTRLPGPTRRERRQVQPRLHQRRRRTTRPGRTYTDFVGLVRDAGLSHLKLHGIRHLNISLQLEAGVSETVIAMRVGHTSPTVIRSTYGHLIGTGVDEPPKRPRHSSPKEQIRLEIHNEDPYISPTKCPEQPR
jgi:integrase